MPTSVIAIFDIGKTNKKILLFDEAYNVVLERSIQLAEITDEDGDPCEDIHALTKWVTETIEEISRNYAFQIKAINFSTYGASFVHLDYTGKPVAPLYNYLKKYPDTLKQKFYSEHGGENAFAMFTASPVLGHLNSGMQLYWLKYHKPQLFERIKISLHLPQYIASLFHKHYYSDLTSIGCHTNLWNFALNTYHDWVKQEGIINKLAPVKPGDYTEAAHLNGEAIVCGVGLHDSSAAMIPYLVSFPEPFLLLSTGTWCISLNPFTEDPLTTEELTLDCLCYLSFKGTPVKAARLFSGYVHEQEVKRLAEHFHLAEDFYKTIPYHAELALNISTDYFAHQNLNVFQTPAEAYTSLISSLVKQQVASTQLVLKDSAVKRIFVDGGFSKNPIFMNLLATAFPAIEVYAAALAQASALGAAMAIHKQWNSRPLQADVLNLKYYAGVKRAHV